MGLSQMGLSGFAYRLMTVLALAVLLSGRARAEDTQRARELFQEGTTFFDVGQFDKAIDAWQRGYKEKSDPGFLYNIAQAYRLSGDPAKAIFFYRGFLRNSPRAPNRAEIEQKIAALQKQIAEQEHARPAAVVPPPKTEGHPLAGTDPVTPPPAPPPPAVTPAGPSPSPSPSPSSSPSPSPAQLESPPPTVVAPMIADRRIEPAGGLASAPPPPESPPESRRGNDLGLGLGVDGWGKSLSSSAEPSFAFALAGGHTFWGAGDRALAFRLGGVFSYTFLRESSGSGSWRETFWSFMVEPALRYRLGARFVLSAAVGIGGIALSGLRAKSALLVSDGKTTYDIRGTQGLFVVRPALSGELGLTAGLTLTAVLAFPYSPKPATYYYAPIARTEFLLGLAYRF